MILPLLAAIAILLVLVISEYLWRKRILPSEITRKIIHISVGSFVAFLPYFISWGYIEFLSLSFIVVVFISSRLKILKSIHSVGRSTAGELFFAFATAILAFFFHAKWIFLAAMLHLGLADGLAAVIGTQYGMHLKYKIFGSIKTLYGSLTFFGSSFFILLFVAVLEGHISPLSLVWLPLLTTAVENVSVLGSDDLFVPLVVAFGLRWL